MPLTPLQTAMVSGVPLGKSSTIYLAKIPIQGSKRQIPFHTQREQAPITGVSRRGAYVVEEGSANIIQVPEQSEETTAQFVIPDLNNTEAEQ